MIACHRHYSSCRPAGFTLVELLVVMVIMALALSGASLALRADDARRLTGEAERLALLLQLAREESRIGGAPLAWVATPQGYAFERRELFRDGPEWLPVRNDEQLRPREFPAGLDVLHVDADGRRLATGERLNLGWQGAQRVVIELVMGRARARIAGEEDRFSVSNMPEGES